MSTDIDTWKRRLEELKQMRRHLDSAADIAENSQLISVDPYEEILRASEEQIEQAIFLVDSAIGRLHQVIEWKEA